MKVYSRSQGKIIEAPNGASPSPTMESTVTTPRPSGSSNIDPEMMKKLFLAAMVSQPKQATSLKSIFEFVNPPKSEADKKLLQEGEQTNKEIDDQLALIQQLKTQIKQGGTGVSATDPFGIRSTLPNKLFGGIQNPLALPENTKKLRPMISDFNTRLFEIAGKAFTGSERGLLKGLILSENQDPSVMEQTLLQAEHKLRQRRGVPGNAQDLFTSSQGRPPISAFDDADDYEE